MAGERDDADPNTRGELHEALRFLHGMSLQGQTELERIDTILAALVKTLLESRRLDAARVEQVLPEVNDKLHKRAANDLAVEIGPAVDKYAVASPVDLDCAALIPLCHGRCCRLTFALSFQDLDEGEVRWDYSRPYKIRQSADGLCSHADRTSHACGVYAARPATCRTYDCRSDSRVWLDFENRIPAPIERVMAPPPPALIAIRPRPPAAPRMDPTEPTRPDDDDGTPSPLAK